MKKRTKSTKKKERRRKPHKEANIDDLISEADAAMESLDLPKSLTLYETASSMLRGKLDLKVDSSDVQEENILKLASVLGKMGEAKVSLGDQDGARDDFSKAIVLLNSKELSGNDTAQLHETKASLHLYLGQLSSEEEALSAYKNGVQELEACISLREGLSRKEPPAEETMAVDGDENEEVALIETRKQLCGAYCSLAELYLTDLCFSENAEIECESYLQSALKITDPVDGQPLVDALQTLASLRLSQNRGVEAVEQILAVYEKMKTGCVALAALVGLGQDEEADRAGQAVELVEVEAANKLPGFEFRCQSAKMLLECASVVGACQQTNNDYADQGTEQQNRCVAASIQVLGSLMAENDEVVETWYLLGCAFAALSPPNVEVAGQYWERAVEMLLKVKEGLEQEISEGGDEADKASFQLQDVLCRIEETNEKLKEIGRNADEQVPMVE